MNLLEPVGQFGSRLQGGKDAASPRYISTRLAPAAHALFPEADRPLLQYINDDGDTIEPVQYVPVVPLALINGAEGIGTGFSTYVPPHDPLDVIRAVRALIAGEGVPGAQPSFAGFRGTVELLPDSRAFLTHGALEHLQDLCVRVSELPVGAWTDSFKEWLEDDRALVDSFQNRSTETSVMFDIRFSEAARAILDSREALWKHLRLSSRRSLANMHLFDASGVIRRFSSFEDVVREHFPVRMALYVRRRDAAVNSLREDLADLHIRLLFVRAVVSGTVRLMELGDEELHASLAEHGVPEAYLKTLLDMPVRSLTAGKIAALEASLLAKAAELAEAESKTAADLWGADLDALEAVLAKR